MSLLADELKDVEIDSDRQVFVDDTGDLGTTSGIRTVEQSIGIHAANVIRPMIGDEMSAQTLEDMQNELRSALRDDPQVEGVSRVEITTIDESSGRIEARVFTRMNNDFNIEVDV